MFIKSQTTSFHKLHSSLHLLSSKELHSCVNNLSDPISNFFFGPIDFLVFHKLRDNSANFIGKGRWRYNLVDANHKKSCEHFQTSSQKRCIFILFALFRRTFSRRHRLPVIHTYMCVWNFCRAYKAVYIMQHTASSSPVLFFCLPI